MPINSTENLWKTGTIDITQGGPAEPLAEILKKVAAVHLNKNPQQNKGGVMRHLNIALASAGIILLGSIAAEAQQKGFPAGFHNGLNRGGYQMRQPLSISNHRFTHYTRPNYNIRQNNYRNMRPGIQGRVTQRSNPGYNRSTGTYRQPNRTDYRNRYRR